MQIIEIAEVQFIGHASRVREEPFASDFYRREIERGHRARVCEGSVLLVRGLVHILVEAISR